jgi:hypothetical protein
MWFEACYPIVYHPTQAVDEKNQSQVTHAVACAPTDASCSGFGIFSNGQPIINLCVLVAGPGVQAGRLGVVAV